MKHLLLSAAVIFLFSACETGYRECNATQAIETTSQKPTAKPLYVETELATEAETFAGGRTTDGLDIGTIRVSQNDERVRLVFDNYKWDYEKEGLGDKVDYVGRYDFVYDPEKTLITAKISGYRGFSAEVPTFSRHNIVEKIYFGDEFDDSSYKFYIKLRQDAPVKVFDLNNPGRIVVDIRL